MEHEFTHNDWHREYDDFAFQTRQRTLTNGLRESLQYLTFFEQRGVNVAEMREEILEIFRKQMPNLWDVPEAEPLIKFAFQ